MALRSALSLRLWLLGAAGKRSHSCTHHAATSAATQRTWSHTPAASAVFTSWQAAFSSEALPGSSPSSPASPTGNSRVLFLGTPQVAANVLRQLVLASPSGGFTVCGVVTRPSTDAGADAMGSNTQVQQAALELGLQPHQILTPATPKQQDFLQAVRQMAPDLCVTAAYGGMLPQAFLDIPRCGTVNIHPSLLPRYRGAAPVQRALQAGDAEIGVSLVYTVLQCDAGPILEQARVPLTGDEQCPELTARLFDLGCRLLLQRMPDILSERGLALAQPQEHHQASHAAKVRSEEAALDVRLSAHQLHNQVRAMAGWPGSYVDLTLQDLQAGTSTPLQVRVLRTHTLPEIPPALQRARDRDPLLFKQRVHFSQGRMLLPCGDGMVLELLQVRPRVVKPNKPAVVSGKEFMQQLGKHCKLLVPLAQHQNG